MSCFYTKNKTTDVGGEITTPKYYDHGYVRAELKPREESLLNVIEVVLDTIDLSLGTIPCGKLPKYDIHNMGAPQVLKLGLLEGIKDSEFYELYLDEAGTPFILTVGDEVFTPEAVYYSVTHGSEKVDYCIIVKGLDPMPERIVKDTINLVVNGEGPGVEVYGLGLFQYSTCGSKIFDYNGCISYADPNLQDTTKDEMDSAFELEPFESLIGYIFTCKKPEDVDVNFSDTSQIPLNFYVGTAKMAESNNSYSVFAKEFKIEEGDIKLDIDITEDVIAQLNDVCDPCYFVEPEELVLFYESNAAIFSVDQVIFTAERITNYKTDSNTDDDTCDTDSPDESPDVSGGFCNFFDTNIATRQLNIGQDFYYMIESTPAGKSIINYTLTAGIPIAYLVYRRGGEWVRSSKAPNSCIAGFAGSTSHVFIPFTGVALITIDKPAIYVNKKTDSSIGNITDSGAAFVKDHTEKIKEIAKEITLTATPIVTLDKPSNTAYYINGITTLIDMAECIQDNDPTTIEELQNTPCELMEQSTSGKATINVTLPFLETDEEIEDAASLLGNKFSADYKNSVSTIPGNSISVSDLGKNFNGGLINKIVWSYQDKSFYKASVTSGPFLTGVDSFNTSMWIRHTDQSLSREGIVIGDHGNGLEFKVYVRNIGTYTALNMTMATIEVGDAVNVTIYNNPAEAYYD